MKRLIMTNLIFLVLVLLGPESSRAQGITDVRPELKSEIGGVIRSYYEAFRRRDADTAVSLWADGGFYYDSLGNYGTTTQMKGEVRAYLLSPIASRSQDSYEMTDLSVIWVAADTAVANYTVITTTVAGGKTMVERDRTTNVLVRRGERWLIVVDHSSRVPTRPEPSISGMPVGWKRGGDNRGGFLTMLDKVVKHGGSSSASIKFAGAEESGFSTLVQAVAADKFRGKRIRLTGWLRAEGTGWGVMWMRVDGDKRLLGFDNMMDRPVKSDGVWAQHEIVLDIPENAVNIYLGGMLSGKGQLWMDDLKLDIVGVDVPTTNQLSPEQMKLVDPDRNAKRSEVNLPVNLDFEAGVIP